MGTTRLLQAVSKVIPVIRAQAAPSVARATFRFGSSSVKDPGIGGKYMPNFTEPATPFPERPANMSKEEFMSRQFAAYCSPTRDFKTKIVASDFLPEKEFFEWQAAQLDDQNGAAGSHRLADQAAFSQATAKGKITRGIDQTVVGKILKEAALPKPEYDLPEKSYAHDLMVVLSNRKPRQHLGPTDQKVDFSRTIKLGPKPYQITSGDVYRIVASEKTNPNWQDDLLRLAAEGKANHRSVHEAIRRSDAVRLELAEYHRITDFCTG